MPKGDERQQSEASKLRGTWITGPGKKVTTRGKDGGSRIVYDRSFNPNAGIAKKTSGFDYKGTTAKKDVIKAGANVLDKEGKIAKRKSFEEHLAAAGRADDPRNWEFHYKAPSGGNFGATKGMSSSERRSNAFSRAKSKAKGAARSSGKEVYEVQKIEYETQGIVEDTDRAPGIAKAKGAGAFGSTRVASNVAAQKMKSNRAQGRARSRAGASAPTTRGIA